jgi:hypothetical protein
LRPKKYEIKIAAGIIWRRKIKMARIRVDNQTNQPIAHRTQQTKTECAKREMVLPERTERGSEPRSFN